jgi:hypothetical protein
VASHQLFEDVSSLLGFFHLEQTLGVVHFDLSNFVGFEALCGPPHDLLDAETVSEGVASVGIAVCEFEEGDVGFGIAVELLQHLLAELEGHTPVLLLRQNLQNSEVDHLSDVGFDCLLDGACEIAQNLFGVDPRDPHVVLVLDVGEGIDGSDELGSDFFRRTGGKKGGNVEKITFRGGVSKHKGLVEFFAVGHFLELGYFLLHFCLLLFLLLLLSCFGFDLLFFLRVVIFFFAVFVLNRLFFVSFFFINLFFSFFSFSFNILNILNFLGFSLFSLNLDLIRGQQLLEPFILLLFIVVFSKYILLLNSWRFNCG